MRVLVVLMAAMAETAGSFSRMVLLTDAKKRAIAQTRYASGLNKLLKEYGIVPVKSCLELFSWAASFGETQAAIDITYQL